MYTRLSCSREEADLESLADLSARLGRDPLLIQGSSGNTSVKVDGALWIKASGTRLADANEQNIFTRVDVSQALWDAPHPGSSANGDLRPSIETTMHARLPQKIVVHVHSVNVIAWSVRRDGREHVARRLAGLHWSWIPHVLSGLPLAQEISKALQRDPDGDIFVLANHGLVVCGESFRSAEALLREVEERLAIVPRRPPHGNSLLEQIAFAGRWTLPIDTGVHALGTDDVSRSILRRGVLYPCQAIFLSSSLSILECADEVPDSPDRPFLIINRLGVLLNRTITRPEYEMLIGLAEVVQRLDDPDSIRYLTPGQVTEVLQAGSYR